MGKKKHASPWARGTQKVHKFLSGKWRSCRKSYILLWSNKKYIFDMIHDLHFSLRHLLEFNVCKKKTQFKNTIFR